MAISIADGRHHDNSFLLSVRRDHSPIVTKEATMSQTVIKLHFAPARPSVRQRLEQAWVAFRAAQRAASTRRQLAALDDRALSDIGISRAQAQFLAETPVWDIHS
jgi:uncharacterized protein YjiS (DUF1127 family)